MAVGDVVSDVYATTSVYHYFQPAVGVEIIITFCGGRGTLTYAGLYDGVNQSASSLADNADFSEGFNTKIGINNTNYLLNFANSSNPAYSGIQIK